MKNKIKTLSREEHYNVCPRCGKEPSLFYKENSYHIGCVDCETGHIDTYMHELPDAANMELLKKMWNISCYSDEYSRSALDVLGIRNEDIIVTAIDDGFIVFSGDPESAFKFLFEKLQESNNRPAYSIKTNIDSRFYDCGNSILVWLTMEYIEQDQKTKQ